MESLLASRPKHDFPGRDDLEAELDRAKIVPTKDVPPNVVTMNSTVLFRIGSSSNKFYLKLVYPQDVDVNGGTISILAPVGSALLGLSEGDVIDWPAPGGGVMQVHIEKVGTQPQRWVESFRNSLLLPVLKRPKPN